MPTYFLSHYRICGVIGNRFPIQVYGALAGALDFRDTPKKGALQKYVIYKCVCAVCVRNLATYIFGLCIYSGCEKTSGSVHLPSGFMYPLAVKKSLVVCIFPSGCVYPLALKKHLDVCSFYPLALCILRLCTMSGSVYMCATQDSMCIMVHPTHGGGM